jgi:site-specific DNA recombinase
MGSPLAGWMAEVQGERLRAEQAIGQAQPSGQLTKEQIRALVTNLKDIAAVLATADPKLKAEVYCELGISVTYDHDRRVMRLESRPETPWARVRVGGAFDPASTPAVLKGKVQLRNVA